LLPVEPGPRSDQLAMSLSVTWLCLVIESQPVAPNWVEAPTLMLVTGAGGVVVPRPGPPLPVENTGVVRPPKAVCQMSASWLAASSPSLSSSLLP
jgi:hypothetical protein